MELALFDDAPLATGAFLNFGADPDSLLLDASRLSFACPLDLAGMLATAHWAAASSMPVTLKLPVDPNVAAYLQRMDVLRQMPNTTHFVGRVPSDTRTDLRGRLLEATPLTAGNANDIAERLGYLVTEYYTPLSETAAHVVSRACGELLGNADEHGRSEVGAFICAQTYTGSTTGTARLELAICDTGMGVQQHLRQNPAFDYLTDDQRALDLALKPGVSGTGDRRGNGLSDLISDTRKHGNIRFQLRSGSGEISVIGSEERCSIKTSPRLDRTNGTWAWLTHGINQT